MAARTLNKLGNAKQVAALKEPGWHGDGGGLYLRIQASGRSWVLVKVVDGKRTERGLGSAAEVSLARARELRDNPELIDAEERAAEEARQAQEEAAAAAAAEASVPTFGDFTDIILADILPGFKNAKHRQQWHNTLKDHAAALTPMRVDRITTDDVLSVIRPLWSTKNETASRLRGRIERILGAAKAAGHRPKDSQNPAAWDDHLEHFLTARKKRDKGHHEAVPVEEVPAVWAHLAKRRNSNSVEALRITILTAARTGETIGAQRKEVDLDAKIWTVPAERMKMGVEHMVALSDHAVEIFERLCVGLEPDDYIFPGFGKKCPHLSNMAMLMLLQDDMGREETVHGFRSTFRDWAGDETRFARDLAEAALAHAIGDASEQAYRRRTALEKRRPLMRAWAQYLETGVTPEWARPIDEEAA